MTLYNSGAYPRSGVRVGYQIIKGSQQYPYLSILYPSFLQLYNNLVALSLSQGLVTASAVVALGVILRDGGIVTFSSRTLEAT